MRNQKRCSLLWLFPKGFRLFIHNFQRLLCNLLQLFLLGLRQELGASSTMGLLRLSHPLEPQLLHIQKGPLLYCRDRDHQLAMLHRMRGHQSFD